MAYVDFVKWVDILQERFDIKENLYDSHTNKGNNIYLFENIECESIDDEEIHDFIVFDLLKETIGSYSEYDISTMEHIIDNNMCAKIIFVFHDWHEEREFYWNIYNNLSAKEKKIFINIYNQKESIYIDGEDVELIVDDRGINYLEYTNNKNDEKLKGWIYNVSLYDLKKLYNATGNRLFLHNIRYGLLDDKIGKSLRNIFKHYIWSDLKKILEKKYPEKLNATDVEKAILGVNNLSEYLLAENFWFHHNGITIFCFEDGASIKSNVITLKSKKVSVINGAQTLTNFFLAEEEIYRKIVDCFQGDENILQDIFSECLGKIFVKTVIIDGNKGYVKSITVGLNTQIPVEEIDILSNSKYVEIINSKLKGKIRILKKGELFNNGMSLLEFIKYYLIIGKQPGKSKNFRKGDAENYIYEMVRKDSLEELADNILKVKNIYSWWDDTKRERYYIDELYKYDDHTVARYGKNYFATYAFTNIDECNFSMEYDSLIFLYNSFVNQFYKSESKLDLGVFKRDDFINIIFNDNNWNEKDALESEMKNQISESLIKVKFGNMEEMTSYINKILCEKSIKISNLHVIIKQDRQYYPDFCFSNKSFEEIFNDMHYKDNKYKEFKESEFCKELNEKKVFMIVEMNAKNECIDINFVEKKISDSESLVKDAKEFYDNIIDIFDSGNSSKLEEDSNKNGFYLVNREFSNEMFEFPDGEYIFYKKIAMDKEKVSQLLNN